MAIFNSHVSLPECTWWLIPLIKWVITPVINRISKVNPLITGVITHLLSGMSHQVTKVDHHCTTPPSLPGATTPQRGARHLVGGHLCHAGARSRGTEEGGSYEKWGLKGF